MPTLRSGHKVASWLIPVEKRRISVNPIASSLYFRIICRATDPSRGNSLEINGACEAVTPNGLLFLGLDSPMVGNSNPKRKALLKGPQSRSWTTFIEAITADGRALTPGMIFKGKYLQTQWFKEEFWRFADWHYITSPNGWTDDHIEWPEEVYLPQIRPLDNSEARLIILDGHGSHETHDWMAMCF
ncbi:DDE superfamily endonuclease [Hirsutella rhossiliensis]|uniref:DDE superfamily endonuclease domain-containing protein n=1 Tax=Hirsutella rhossiliensis TaxID=111463 RepID=A0A9P8N748_9HYPO|nr:DDE superfamily endonuclease domain-containing protein [Hirsutella rhossiliensis]KAH0968833.1 DDE superfamily endonuclease domain-containing protein [Hirsutella rhossiliensis]